MRTIKQFIEQRIETVGVKIRIVGYFNEAIGVVVRDSGDGYVEIVGMDFFGKVNCMAPAWACEVIDDEEVGHIELDGIDHGGPFNAD